MNLPQNLTGESLPTNLENCPDYQSPPAKIPPIIFHPDLADNAMRALRSGQRVDWGLQELGLLEVHEQSGGEGVHVGVVDSGLPRDGHPDLPQPVHLSNLTNERDANDNNGHGTHVSGIICGQDNTIGMLGVAPRAKLSHVKIFTGAGSGSSDWIARGIRRLVDEGCDIINFSGGGPFWRPTQEALDYCAQNDVLFIVAAGNAALRGMDYPALHPTSYAVGSTRRGGDISGYSSRGEEVDIACPGEQVFSTWPGGRYNTISGTSMAAPYFAGVAALMFAARTDYSTKIRTAQQLRTVMKNYTDDAGRPGHDVEYGDGIPRVADFVNAFRASLSPGTPI